MVFWRCFFSVSYALHILIIAIGDDFFGDSNASTIFQQLWVDQENEQNGPVKQVSIEYDYTILNDPRI